MLKNNSNWDVPSFNKVEFQEKMNRYCVCVFVINEGDKLLKQLKKMQCLSNQVDIVIADGGSTDGSTEHHILKKFNVNTLLVKTDEGKLGSQMRIGFSWALNRGYDGVVVIDGNNKDSVVDIPHFIQKLSLGYDHIQGSRFIPGGHHENTPLSRLIGLKLIHLPLMRRASGFNYTDTTNGFRAYSRKLLMDEEISAFRDVFTGYELHYYLALKSAKLNFKCIEQPVSRVYPAFGKIPTKISPIKGSFEVILKLFGVIFGKYG